VDRARFRQMVRPGDRVELEALGLANSEDGGKIRGVAMVDGKLAVEAELTFALMPISNPRLIERRREVLQTWLSGSIDK
jgi:3-hydroxyacyl-[acyl-carrier-protein] dehydratase